MKDIETLFIFARDIYKKQGGYKGNFANSKGTKVCALGAMQKAQLLINPNYNQNPVNFMSFARACDILADISSQQFPDRVVPEHAIVPSVNDHEDTTKEDMLMVFDKAVLIASEIVE